MAYGAAASIERVHATRRQGTLRWRNLIRRRGPPVPGGRAVMRRRGVLLDTPSRALIFESTLLLLFSRS